MLITALHRKSVNSKCNRIGNIEQDASLQEKRALTGPTHPQLSVARQYGLVGLAR